MKEKNEQKKENFNSTENEISKKINQNTTEPVKNDIETKESEDKKYEDIINDLTNTLKRVQAEFENYKKRMEQQRKDMIADSARNILTELTPVLDHFDLAIKHAEKSSKEDMLFGFKMIYEQISGIMKNNGLEEIYPKDKEFNPYEHEAVLCEECDKKSQTVTEVIQKGYKVNNKVIRHAKVKIAK